MVFILSILSFVITLHPLHISVTEITYDEKEKELEIISRIFIDDLEAAIEHEKKLTKINLSESEKTVTDKLVNEYIQRHFGVSLNGHSQKVIYLGHELESDAMLCYIQVKNVKRWNTIEIQNSIITELYEDQSNLVHVTVRTNVKSLRLMKDNPIGKLTFEVK